MKNPTVPDPKVPGTPVPGPKTIPEMFAAQAARYGGRAVLQEKRDGKYRQIKIVPRDSSYNIRARKGYYAAKNSDIR